MVVTCDLLHPMGPWPHCVLPGPAMHDCCSKTQMHPATKGALPCGVIPVTMPSASAKNFLIVNDCGRPQQLQQHIAAVQVMESSISQAPNPAAGHTPRSFTQAQLKKQFVAAARTKPPCRLDLFKGWGMSSSNINQLHELAAAGSQVLQAKHATQFTPAGHSTTGTAQCVAACAMRSTSLSFKTFSSRLRHKVDGPMRSSEHSCSHQQGLHLGST